MLYIYDNVISKFKSNYIHDVEVSFEYNLFNIVESPIYTKVISEIDKATIKVINGNSFLG